MHGAHARLIFTSQAHTRGRAVPPRPPCHQPPRICRRSLRPPFAPRPARHFRDAPLAEIPPDLSREAGGSPGSRHALLFLFPRRRPEVRESWRSGSRPQSGPILPRAPRGGDEGARARSASPDALGICGGGRAGDGGGGEAGPRERPWLR